MVLAFNVHMVPAIAVGLFVMDREAEAVTRDTVMIPLGEWLLRWAWQKKQDFFTKRTAPARKLYLCEISSFSKSGVEALLGVLEELMYPCEE